MEISKQFFLIITYYMGWIIQESSRENLINSECLVIFSLFKKKN